MKLGLAMSGGGIKGAAHIGVIQALQEENIKVIRKIGRGYCRWYEYRKYCGSSLCNGIYSKRNAKII